MGRSWSVPGSTTGRSLSAPFANFPFSAPRCGPSPWFRWGSPRTGRGFLPCARSRGKRRGRRWRRCALFGWNRGGETFAMAADEYYLLAEREIPGRKAYGSFPQIENGVGLLRKFRDDAALLFRRKRWPAAVGGTVVTGVSSAANRLGIPGRILPPRRSRLSSGAGPEPTDGGERDGDRAARRERHPARRGGEGARLPVPSVRHLAGWRRTSSWTG